MKYTYCPHCGDKLTHKEIGDEGLMPYCIQCNLPIFDVFHTCIIVVAVNEYDEVVLLRQNYVSDSTYVCVAGHIKTGETAEDTVIREIQEEIGLLVEQVNYVKSYFYEKKGMLMLGFFAKVKKESFVLSKEVDEAEWFSFEEALTKVKQDSIAMQLLSDTRVNFIKS